MSDKMPDDLWRVFSKTAPAFEARFKTEEDCRACWIEACWGGKPACAKCKCERVWPIRTGTTPGAAGRRGRHLADKETATGIASDR